MWTRIFIKLFKTHDSIHKLSLVTNLYPNDIDTDNMSFQFAKIFFIIISALTYQLDRLGPSEKI